MSVRPGGPGTTLPPLTLSNSATSRPLAPMQSGREKSQQTASRSQAWPKGGKWEEGVSKRVRDGGESPEGSFLRTSVLLFRKFAKCTLSKVLHYFLFLSPSLPALRETVQRNCRDLPPIQAHFWTENTSTHADARSEAPATACPRRAP